MPPVSGILKENKTHYRQTGLEIVPHGGVSARRRARTHAISSLAEEKASEMMSTSASPWPPGLPGAAPAHVASSAAPLLPVSPGSPLPLVPHAPFAHTETFPWIQGPCPLCLINSSAFSSQRGCSFPREGSLVYLCFQNTIPSLQSPHRSL